MEGVANVGDAEDLAGAVAVSALRGRSTLRTEDGVRGQVDDVAWANFDNAVLGQLVGGTVLRAGVSRRVARSR
jgi:hypothetical protein